MFHCPVHATADRRRLPILLLLLMLLPLFGGCASMGNLGIGAKKDGEETHPEPYHPAEFRDLLIPSELNWQRDKSMVVQTESFAGGVLYFSGRVEVNSLTDYFVNSMPQKGWKLVGSVKYKDVLLSFIKPHKTCTIIINDTELGRKANISVYITEDIAGSKGGDPGTPAKASPFSF